MIQVTTAQAEKIRPRKFIHRSEKHKSMDVTAANQVADASYTQDILTTGFPAPRDFALAFYAENPLKPGESRKIKLRINGKRCDDLLQFRNSGAFRGQKSAFFWKKALSCDRI